LRSIAASVALTASFLVGALPALAQDDDGDRITLGVGLGSLPKFEGADQSSLLPVPGALGRVSGFKFLYVGNRLSVDLIRDGSSGWDFQLGPAVAVGLNRTSIKGIDDARIRALGKVGTAVELGGYAGIGRWGVVTSEFDRISATVTWRRDVAGGHDGTIITPSLTYMTPLSTKSIVVLAASGSHVDGNYAGRYFSITPGQSVASGLPVYSAEGGWKDWTLGGGGSVSLTGDLTGGLSLVGGLAYTRLLGDIADSPVVRLAGSRDQWMGGLGLAYTF